MTNNQTTILAIESSCDDTGVAVVRKRGEQVTVLAQLVSSQTDIHAKTGGVIPEIAAREHVQAIGPMIASVMNSAGVQHGQLDSIAVTVGPGLMPSLAIGVQTARSLAYAWNKPIVPVHHIEGHVYSALLENGSSKSYKLQVTSSSFPALALIVSGGHTMFIKVTDHLSYSVLGETRDDAVGEVFDKVARMLGLSYPGGPKVSVLAEQGNPSAFAFPRPMSHSHDLNMSYSGLKTAVLYQIRDLGVPLTEKNIADISASFEQAIIDSLITKLRFALESDNYRTLLFAGGVAGNQRLRDAIEQETVVKGVEFAVAPQELCGDNAVMIGQVGVFAFEAGRKKSWKEVEAIARVSIENFSL